MSVLSSTAFRRGILVAADLLLLSLAWLLAYWLRLDSGFYAEFPQADYSDQCRVLLPWVVIPHVLLFAALRLYHAMPRWVSVAEGRSIAIASGIVVAWLFAVNAVIEGRESFGALPVADLGDGMSVFRIPRQVPLIYFLLAGALTGGLRYSRRLWMETRGGFEDDADATLVVGAGHVAEKALRELLQSPSAPFRPVSVVSTRREDVGARIRGVKVEGTVEDIPALLTRHAIQSVLIALDEDDPPVLRGIVAHCTTASVAFHIIPTMRDLQNGRVQFSPARRVKVDDLLGRDPVALPLPSDRNYMKDQVVMVTGAGGSIGAEIARQAAGCGPRALVLVGKGEHSLAEAAASVRAVARGIDVHAVVADVRDESSMARAFARFRPAVVFHAAAHKHVPLMETQPAEAVKNNVLGTAVVAWLAHEFSARRFVLVSTDKAVRPTSVMGASKRVAEQIVFSLAGESRTMFNAVRFGNVLGSRGSAIPLFERQIAAGGPVTVTHPEATRYFMTIAEAVSLVLQAGAEPRTGSLFLLDMGKPVRVLELVRTMIALSGLREGRDIEIAYTGLRPGEKIHEELLTAEEGAVATGIGKVWATTPRDVAEWGTMQAVVKKLRTLADEAGDEEILECLRRLVPDYHPAALEELTDEAALAAKFRSARDSIAAAAARVREELALKAEAVQSAEQEDLFAEPKPAAVPEVVVAKPVVVLPGEEAPDRGTLLEIDIEAEAEETADGGEEVAEDEEIVVTIEGEDADAQELECEDEGDVDEEDDEDEGDDGDGPREHADLAEFLMGGPAAASDVNAETQEDPPAEEATEHSDLAAFLLGPSASGAEASAEEPEAVAEEGPAESAHADLAEFLLGPAVARQAAADEKPAAVEIQPDLFDLAEERAESAFEEGAKGVATPAAWSVPSVTAGGDGELAVAQSEGGPVGESAPPDAAAESVADELPPEPAACAISDEEPFMSEAVSIPFVYLALLDEVDPQDRKELFQHLAMRIPADGKLVVSGVSDMAVIPQSLRDRTTLLPASLKTPPAQWNETARTAPENALIVPVAPSVRLNPDFEKSVREFAEKNREGLLLYCDHTETKGGKETFVKLHDHAGCPHERFDFGPMTIYRAKAVLALGGFDESLAHAWEYDMHLRMMQEGYLLRVPGSQYKVILPEAKDGAPGKLHSPGRGKLGGFSYVFYPPDVEKEVTQTFEKALKQIGAWIDHPTVPIPQPKQKPELLATVVIPILNRVKFIGNAIEKVQKGTFQDFEMVIVDNGSTDGTVELLQEIGRKDPRIRLLHGKGGSIASALNEGIRAARGKYICQLDSDDQYAPTTLERMVGHMESHPKCGLAISYYKLMDENGVPIDDVAPITHSGYSRNQILRRDGGGALRVFPKTVLEEFGLYDEVNYGNFGEDYDMVLKVGEKYDVDRVHEVLYYYRRHNDNTDVTRDPEMKYRNKNHSRQMALRRRIAINEKLKGAAH